MNDTQELQAQAPISAAELIKRSRLKTKQVYIEALDATVTMRQLSRLEAEQIDERASYIGPDGKTLKDQRKVERGVLLTALVEPHMSAAQLDELEEGSIEIWGALVNAALEVNRMGRFRSSGRG